MHFSGNLLCQRHCFWCLGDLNGLLTTQIHYQLITSYHITCEHFADFDLIDISQCDQMLSIYINSNQMRPIPCNCFISLLAFLNLFVIILYSRLLDV
jgi:hypothetical protein